MLMKKSEMVTSQAGGLISHRGKVSYKLLLKMDSPLEIEIHALRSKDEFQTCAIPINC